MTDRQIVIEDEEHFNYYIDNLIETGTPVIALFTAPTWCVPCQRFEPHWDKAQEHLTGYIFAKIYMGASPEDTGQHWATEKFGIRGVPQVKLFNDDGVWDITARAVVPFIREIESHG